MFGVWGLRLRFFGLEFGVWGLGFRVQGLGLGLGDEGLGSNPHENIRPTGVHTICETKSVCSSNTASTYPGVAGDEFNLIKLTK